jgi:hypothetical protein
MEPKKKLSTQPKNLLIKVKPATGIKEVKEKAEPAVVEEPEPAVYRYLDNKGKGLIADLAREAFLNKELHKLDAFLQHTVPQFLINDGKEEMVYASLIGSLSETNKTRLRWWRNCVN